MVLVCRGERERGPWCTYLLGISRKSNFLVTSCYTTSLTPLLLCLGREHPPPNATCHTPPCNSRNGSNPRGFNGMRRRRLLCNMCCKYRNSMCSKYRIQFAVNTGIRCAVNTGINLGELSVSLFVYETVKCSFLKRGTCEVTAKIFCRHLRFKLYIILLFFASQVHYDVCSLHVMCVVPYLEYTVAPPPINMSLLKQTRAS